MHRTLKPLIMASLASLMAACHTPKESADLMIINASIYTVDDSFSMASAMVIRDGVILAVGETEVLLQKYTADSVMDAQGKVIFPGFYDPHCHFYHYGAGLATRTDLTGAQSFDEVLERMKQFAGVRREGWLAGRGWDQNRWPGKQFPDNAELNRLFPDRPVILIRVDGHMALVNDIALKKAGMDANTRVTGGEVQLRKGKPTGILVDKAADILKELFLKETTETDEGGEELVKGILQGQENCFAAGLTTVADAGLEYDEVRLLMDLQQQGKLKMQVYAMLNYAPENQKHFISKGVYHEGPMHIRSVKFYADGALGSRGALLLEPYSDKPGYHGILTIDPDTFLMDCKEIYKAGYQVNTHAIGDSANRLVLHTYAKVLKVPNDLRWRIEHAQVVNPADQTLFARFSIIPSVNAVHATSDMYWAGERLGSERIAHAYAYKELLGLNGWLCNGSDFPMEQISPLLGFYAAVTRRDLEGYPDGGFQYRNAISREEALRAMTIWAAKACFEENGKGSLEPGKAADFVILDQDIVTAPASAIPQTRVLETWINGKKVY